MLIWIFFQLTETWLHFWCGSLIFNDLSDSNGSAAFIFCKRPYLSLIYVTPTRNAKTKNAVCCNTDSLIHQGKGVESVHPKGKLKWNWRNQACRRQRKWLIFRKVKTFFRRTLFRAYWMRLSWNGRQM